MEEKKGSGVLLIGVGTHLTSMIAAGFIVGYGLDYLLDTTPIFMLVFGVLGFVGGLIKVYEILTKYYK